MIVWGPMYFRRFGMLKFQEWLDCLQGCLNFEKKAVGHFLKVFARPRGPRTTGVFFSRSVCDAFIPTSPPAQTTTLISTKFGGSV